MTYRQPRTICCTGRMCLWYMTVMHDIYRIKQNRKQTACDNVSGVLHRETKHDWLSTTEGGEGSPPSGKSQTFVECSVLHPASLMLPYAIQAAFSDSFVILYSFDLDPYSEDALYPQPRGASLVCCFRSRLPASTRCFKMRSTPFAIRLVASWRHVWILSLKMPFIPRLGVHLW